MAHGSDVRSLETTATYDVHTETFDLHSPTLGSTKWWPAALGRTATHAIIHARLVVRGKFIGVKPFFVQLRDLETHENVPGVESGDIGPTMGLVACVTSSNLQCRVLASGGCRSTYEGFLMWACAPSPYGRFEEGFCRFDHVTLPRIALLARYGEVSVCCAPRAPAARASPGAVTRALCVYR
jgi:alkylation response protein AidB-like acyl-CoA dehydrogenase